MNTEHLNNNPTIGSPDEVSKKASKAKKIAGETAKFAAAAGLGVAGTMAADAMSKDINEDDIITEVDSVENSEVADETVETPEEFDPNDIRLDNAAESHPDHSHVVASSTDADDIVNVDVPQPISQENDIAMINPDDVSLEQNQANDGSASESIDSGDIIVDEYSVPDGCNEFDHPQDLLADGDDPNDIDILDDLMA